MKIEVDEFEIDLFPGINDVFISENEGYEKVFFPVLSLKLSDVNPNWGNNWIHLIQFNEDPYNQETVQYFNNYCKGNTIAFDLIDGKYRFKTDLKFFDLTNDWQEWHQKTSETYIESKNLFLAGQSDLDTDDLVIGGEPDWWQGDETPMDPDGNPMNFITEFETERVCEDSCYKKIYLFYSPQYKLAVQVYQNT